MLQPGRHQWLGTETTRLRHHLDRSGKQLAALTTHGPEATQTNQQGLKTLPQHPSLQRCSGARRQHALTGQGRWPVRSATSQQVILEILGGGDAPLTTLLEPTLSIRASTGDAVDY